MAARSTENIRNVAVCGHATGGKTTLVESLLHLAGAIDRKGSVAEGSTVCDSDDQEKERKHSIDLACAHLEKDGVLVNLIDTPGYRDFLGQFYCASSAVDGLLVVVGAEEGVQPTTRKVWERAEAAGLPCLVVINRCDREHADFDRVLSEVREQLGAGCVPLTLPDASGPPFSAVKRALGPDADADEEAKSAFVEAIVETDEDLMEAYLGGEAVAPDAVSAQLVKAVAGRDVFPVLATSAEKEVGLDAVLDALIHIMPPASEPLGRELRDVDDPEATTPLSTGPGDPFCARVFKVISDPYVGKLTLLRVWSGSLAVNGLFVGPHSSKPEKAGKIVKLQGKEQDAVETASAGDLVAMVRVESLKTFDVITAEKKAAMTAPAVPVPMCSYAVSPKTKADEKKFAESIQKLLDEDVCLRGERERRTNELVVAGISQLHLQVIWNRLKARYGVEVKTKEPKIPYLETITGGGDHRYRHKKQTGGAGEFAEVALRLEPLERGAGNDFKSEVFGGAISASYVQSAEKGIRALMEHGVVAGCPVVDTKVTIYDGKEHPVDSKDIAFQKAGREAFKAAMLEAKPVLLEPIVNLEVTFPGQHTGDIQGDLTRRRGRVQGVDTMGSFQVLKALIPLAEIADYASSLGSITGGQGSYHVEPAHYEVVPANVQQKVVAAYQKSLKED